METRVEVNVKMTIPVNHLKEAVGSFIEKLARDEIVDILQCAENKIDIKRINAISKNGIEG